LANGDKDWERRYRSVHDVGAWLYGMASTLWIKYQFGFVVTTVFTGWRAWIWMDMSPKVVWTYGKVRSVVETVDTWSEMYDELKTEHDSGRLDWVYNIVYFLLAAYCLYHFVLPWGKYLRLQVVYMFSPSPTPNGTPPGARSPNGTRPPNTGRSADVSESEEEESEVKKLTQQNQETARVLGLVVNRLEAM